MYRTTFLSKEIVFGTFFLGEWIENSGAENAKLSFELLQKNPFKYVPLFLQVAINSTAEIFNTQKVELHEVFEEVDKVGGINSKVIQDILEVFTTSMTDKLGNEKKAKKVVGK